LKFTSNDTTNLARVTLVFALEKGIWKVQHIHNSFPNTNIEKLGIEHKVLEALLEAAESSNPDLGHHGSATVMFTDIADSTALAEALGDARWARVVQDHVSLISEKLADQEGRLIKSLGDGTMSTFASAGAAMQAGLAIQSDINSMAGEPRLRVRIGLHTGDVVEAGDDFFGTVVNKAARIAAAARPGEIRVSETTRAMVGGATGFGFDDPLCTPLKGLDGEHIIYRLEWQT
jgi:class 3 adenylate cyclase